MVGDVLLPFMGRATDKSRIRIRIRIWVSIVYSLCPGRLCVCIVVC